ncbi:MAG: hypothetical protein NEA02_15200 [Thermoanaerobaculia bacterium]|nr:hypothetical protein [Thermoanaerobaculia bacterium]
MPGGRLYVPKLYAPLLPGSIYPDKKMPVPAKGRPALVVVCPERGDCRKDEILEQAARRGMVVLVFTRPPFAPPKDDLLRTRPEANAERTGWLLVSPTDDFLRKWMGAGATPCVLLFPSSPSKQIPNAVSRRVLLAALNGSEANLSSEGVIEKLYAPDAAGRLPREAYRDAVEWLVGELGAR